MRTARAYFDMADEAVSRIFARDDDVWDVLKRLDEVLETLLGGRRTIKGAVARGAEVSSGPLYLGPDSIVEPGAFIAGRAYIGAGVQVRHGAYIRDRCILLDGAVLGHASEAKNAIFLPGAKAPHFAYVGDSVLGHRVNLGAGTKISNLKVASSGQETVCFELGGEVVDTGLRKMGAIIGDDVQIGCNVVLNPGSLIGPRSVIYPGTVVPKGFSDSDTIIKLRQVHELASFSGS